jgi:hypothetical protein
VTHFILVGISIEVKVVLSQENKIILFFENACFCLSIREWMRGLKRICLSGLWGEVVA